MHAKLKKYLSFHREGIEGLRMIHKIDSSAIPVTLLLALVIAIYPYINLFTGAIIIDSLIGGSFQNAIYLAILMIIFNFILGIIQDGLARIAGYKVLKIEKLSILEVMKKSLEIDYETLEDAKTLEKVSSSIFSINFKGGFGTLLRNYCNIFEGVFSICTSITLVFVLCFQNGFSEDKFLSVVASTPMSIILVVIFIFANIAGNLVIARYNNKKSLEMFNEHLKVERTLGYYVQQIYSNYERGKVIRLYDMNKGINDKFESSINFGNSMIKRMNQVHLFAQGMESLISGVSLTISYIIVVVKVLVGAITIGEVAKYVGAIAQLNGAMGKIVKFNDAIRLQCDYLKVFTDFIKLKNKRETGSIPIEKRLDNEYEIEFHNVSFAYPGSHEMILKDVSCKLNMKDKMAVVGRNGAGKTTFIKLIARLYDPTEGYITLNGVDIKKYNYKEYLNLFSVVFQDFSLFAFPIEENVVASTESEEDKVWKMLELAGIKDRIEETPEKLKTPLFKYDEGGIEFSGGEQQKIAIARALYKDAPFVILDEPTAALDPVSEYEIYSRFHRLVNDKTSVYISHRMSSCRFCNDILVFDNGKIIQRGSHDELMKDKDNLYSSMWNAQASYYTTS